MVLSTQCKILAILSTKMQDSHRPGYTMKDSRRPVSTMKGSFGGGVAGGPA